MENMFKNKGGGDVHETGPCVTAKNDSRLACRFQISRAFPAVCFVNALGKGSTTRTQSRKRETRRPVPVVTLLDLDAKSICIINKETGELAHVKPFSYPMALGQSSLIKYR